MQISQIEITGFSYGVLNFVVSFKTQKNSMAKKYICKYHQSEKGKKKLPKMKSLLIFGYKRQSLSNRHTPRQIIGLMKEKQKYEWHYNHNCTLQGLLNGDEGWFPSQLVQEIENKVCAKPIASPFFKLNLQGSSTGLISELPSLL